MGKQKRKQAEPDVSNKMLKINKKSKPNAIPAAGPKAVQSPGLQKTEKKRAPKSDTTSEPGQELPTVQNDAKLKEIADKSLKAEQLAASEEQLAASEEQLLAPPASEPEESSSREVVKVKRSNPAPKLKESAAKSYMSITGGPDLDDKRVKVPSYSYMKNRGIVYIR